MRRAIDVVDLGPSGSDAFSELEAKYGFKLVDDWPAVADYQGDFWYIDGPRRGGWFKHCFESRLLGIKQHPFLYRKAQY